MGRKAQSKKTFIDSGIQHSTGTVMAVAEGRMSVGIAADQRDGGIGNHGLPPSALYYKEGKAGLQAGAADLKGVLYFER